MTKDSNATPVCLHAWGKHTNHVSSPHTELKKTKQNKTICDFRLENKCWQENGAWQMEITEMTDTDTSKGSKRQNKMWQD